MAGRKRRQFGWLRQLPSGRWQAQYVGPDGRRRAAPETFARKQDGAAWLSMAEAEMARGEWHDPTAAKELLGAYGERWITERPGLRPRTVELYRWLLRKHIAPGLGGRRLADLDDNPAAVRAWRSGLLAAGVSPSMAAKAYRLLRAILMTAVDDRTIRHNRCRIKGAGTESPDERPTLTVAQVVALAGRMPSQYSALILLATYASLRWGEVIALHRRDLNLDTATVHVRQAYAELSTGAIVLGPPKSR